MQPILPFHIPLTAFFSSCHSNFSRVNVSCAGIPHVVSVLCWMGLGSWLRGNLELILGNTTDVHGVTSLADGALPWCCREGFL